MSPTKSYREIVKSELQRRQRLNPNYSLRAFARDLQISPSSLSEMLRGRVGLSPARARHMAARMSLNPAQSEIFEDLVTMRHSRTQKSRNTAKARVLQKLENPTWRLQADRFDMLSDWPYLATLELAATQSRGCQVSDMERRLGLDSQQATLILDRLVRLGYLAENAGGSFYPTKPSTFIESPTPSKAIRNFHRQILALANDSIEKQEIHERFLSASILSIPEDLLPTAYQEIQKCLAKVAAKGRQAQSPDKKIYCLSAQLFRLEKKGEFP